MYYQGKNIMGLKLRNICMQFNVESKYFPVHAIKIMVKWRTSSRYTLKFDSRWRCMARCIPCAINTFWIRDSVKIGVSLAVGSLTF